MRPPPPLGLDLRLLALAEIGARAPLAIEERLHALLGMDVAGLVGGEAQAGDELAQGAMAPGHGPANVDPGRLLRKWRRSAYIAGSCCTSETTGAKRSPCSATRARTAAASNTSRSGSPESAPSRTSSHVSGVDTVGRSRARSE